MKSQQQRKQFTSLQNFRIGRTEKIFEILEVLIFKKWITTNNESLSMIYIIVYGDPIFENLNFEDFKNLLNSSDSDVPKRRE